MAVGLALPLILISGVTAETTLRAISSFYPLYEWTKQVGGDRIEVVNLVPVGVEPHDFEPTPADVLRIQGADLLIHQGGGLQPALDKLVKTLKGPRPVVLTVTQGFQLRKGLPDPHGHHRSEASDPHIWLDPLLAKQIVGRIAGVLTKLDVGRAATYRQNAEVYQAKLDALHVEFQHGLAKCRLREIITSHAAFAYLAARYGFGQTPIMGLSPNEEPSPRQLARLADLARKRDIKVIYFETLVSGKVAETLAREVGAKTLVLNPIEGLTTQQAAQGKDYLALMRENLMNLREGLECK
jgi:zinc transport system substrate-binding protein